MIEVMAKVNSEDLVQTVVKLVDLWKKGAYIGSLSILFKSYLFIQNETEKKNVKKVFRDLYASMRRIYPKLEKVDWV
jgi:hypothetical protein